MLSALHMKRPVPHNMYYVVQDYDGNSGYPAGYLRLYGKISSSLESMKRKKKCMQI